MIGDSSFLVELAVVEDFSREDFATVAAETLVYENYSADFLFGPYSPELTESTVQVASGANTLVISSSSLLSSNCDDDLLIVLQPPVSKFQHSLFQTVQSLGAESMSVVVDMAGNSFCGNISEMTDMASLYNVSIMDFFVIDTEDYIGSLSDIVLALQLSGVDVVTGCAHDNNTGNPYKQSEGLCAQLPLLARNISYSPKGLFFLNCDFEDEETLEQLGTAVQYLISVVPWFASSLIRDTPSSTNWTSAEFRHYYLTKYKSAPSFHAGKLILLFANYDFGDDHFSAQLPLSQVELCCCQSWKSCSSQIRLISTMVVYFIIYLLWMARTTQQYLVTFHLIHADKTR